MIGIHTPWSGALGPHICAYAALGYHKPIDFWETLKLLVLFGAVVGECRWTVLATLCSCWQWKDWNSQQWFALKRSLLYTVTVPYVNCPEPLCMYFTFLAVTWGANIGVFSILDKNNIRAHRVGHSIPYWNQWAWAGRLLSRSPPPPRSTGQKLIWFCIAFRGNILPQVYLSPPSHRKLSAWLGVHSQNRDLNGSAVTVPSVALFLLLCSRGWLKCFNIVSSEIIHFVNFSLPSLPPNLHFGFTVLVPVWTVSNVLIFPSFVPKWYEYMNSWCLLPIWHG